MIVLNCDLTTLKIDIIVNAANQTLMGGGGIDGAIHRKAGMKLREECLKLKGCMVGEAKMTDAYNLPCNKIIHTVGPIYKGEESKELLKNSYKNTMLLAEEYRKSNKLDKIKIAFPCISTGAYGYPKDEAAQIAINTIKEINNKNIDVIFACYELVDYKIYIKNIHRIEIE